MLGELPLEILRRICSYLSPEAALSFAHSCRNTYQVCDDWIVWRVIVKGSARVRTETPAVGSGEERGNKKGAMGDANIVRAGAGSCRSLAIEQYLPQLLVLGCKH
jgi:F-box-like